MQAKPHLKKCHVIPPEQDGDFVAAMTMLAGRDVLDVYESVDCETTAGMERSAMTETTCIMWKQRV